MTKRSVQDRLTLLLSLVPYVLTNGPTEISELAERFDISPSEVEDAARQISMSGRPGEGGGYLPNDLFDIDWELLEEGFVHIVSPMGATVPPRLSAREAAALIAGLQYLSSLPDFSDGAAIGTLATKLARGSAGRVHAIAIESGGVDAVLGEARAAIDRGESLRFDYANSRAEVSSRTVDPMVVSSAGGVWYLRGWCHTREALRTFRVDRMSHASVTGEEAQHRASEDVGELFDRSDMLERASVRVDPAIADEVAGYVSAADAERLARAKAPVEVTVRVAHWRALASFAARFAGRAEVTGPSEALEATAAFAADALAAYRSRSSVAGEDG